MFSRIGLTLGSLLIALTGTASGAAVYVASDSGQFGTLDFATGAVQSIGNTPDVLFRLVLTPAGY